MNGSSGASSPSLQFITLRNLLSFGPERLPIPLTTLNVLIGPNGSGKSNLIEAVALLRATPSADLREILSRGGGAEEWIWKGNPKEKATIDAVVANLAGLRPLWHGFAFSVRSHVFVIEDERIEDAQQGSGPGDPSSFYYRYEGGTATLTVKDRGPVEVREPLANDRSILAQRRDPDQYPELAYLTDFYNMTRIYREWNFGRNTVFRTPQRADMRTDRLEEDFSNLGLFLNKLRRSPRTKQAILGALRDLYAGIDDFDVSVEGGTVQVFLTEGNFTIPATRLSDGTLRYLCLLAILLDPDPPRLVCIEEPELGLHPDLIPKIADLLVDASQRMQLIVTTHSDILVDAMTERPESVLVCEKHDGQTQINRLDPERLSKWLEKYRLGELWSRGEIGGNRW